MQIRQEINIIDKFRAAVASDALTNEIVSLDTTQYNGTVSYYFEIVAYKTAGDSVSVSLRRSGTSTDDATIASASIPDTTMGLVRSTAFTPPAGATDYQVFIDYTSGSGVRLKSARIVIIQNATTLTNTETQIEIGNYETTRTNEAAAALTNPKYWKYTAANWDGTKTFYAEAVYDSSSMDTITVALEVSSDIATPSWSTAVTIVSAAETTVPTRTRVAFTPVDGSWYRLTSFNGSMDSHDIYRAGIVVQQVDGVQLVSDTSFNEIQGGTSGSGEVRQAFAQAFKINATSSITGVKLRLKKTGSPTDTLNIDIVSSRGGSSLANATQSVSALTNSFVEYTYTFGSPVSLTGGNTYYIQLSRSPDTFDSVNRIDTNVPFGATYPDGASSNRSNNVWGLQNGGPTYFELTGQTGITKLEPQYLLANTLFAAGTGLQTFLTKWDSTEWDGVTNTYYFQGEAANGSTSDVSLWRIVGGSSISDLTNIDNAQISSAVTMPFSQNLDTKATTNAGDVAAARILVATVVSAGTTTSTSSSSSSSISTSSSSVSTSSSSSSVSTSSSSSSSSSTLITTSTSSSSSSVSTSSSSSSVSTSSSSSSSVSTSSSSSSVSSSSSSSSVSTSSSSSSVSTSSSSSSSSSVSTSSSSSSISTSSSSSSISSTSSSTLPGDKVYSREGVVTLGADDTNLANAFTSQEYIDVAVEDLAWVDQSVGNGYSVFEFKNQNINSTDPITVTWEGQTNLAPSSSPVSLQIYNRVGTTWETLQTDSLSGTGVDFTLTGVQSTNLSNYYDGSNWVSCRVYQQN